MATNPHIPSNAVTTKRERGPQLVPAPTAPQRHGSSVPGVVAAIVVAIALVVVIFYVMPKTPMRFSEPSTTEVPTQSASSQVRFTSMRMRSAPGAGLNLDGQVMNQGDRSILGAMVRLTFRDSSGAVVGTVTSPVEGMTDNSQKLMKDGFSTDPLKPGDTRLFRVSASRIPAGWNHIMPEMTVLAVSAGDR